MPTFEPDVVSAILEHMNGDHDDDNLLIVRAFVDPAATTAEMTGFDGDGGLWTYRTPAGEFVSRVPWREPISERPQVRAEIVSLYERAATKLGVEQRPH